MKRSRGHSAVLFLAIVCQIFMPVAFAQMGPPPGGPHPGFRAGEGPGGLPFGPHPGKVVTGAPYSADVSNSVVQTLSDGNSIQRSTTGHVARDAQGRTYSQETITGGMLARNGPTTITFISDPVAGYTYVLNANTKVAMRRALKAPPAKPEQTANGQPPSHPVPPNVMAVDLGTQIVNGVSATGKSITRTVPAGEMGNAQPIISTSEVWYAPSLQVVVSSKRTDPRTGTATYALTNIQAAVPAATLFQVPADYTIQDAPKGGGFGPRHGGGPRPPAPPAQ
jgi:predicted secreted protein